MLTCLSPGCLTCWPGELPVVAADIPDLQREALEIARLLRPAGDKPPTAHAVGLAVFAALQAIALARYPHEFGWGSGSGIVYLIFLATMALTGVVALMRREGVP
jgi:hypothetical protein